MQKKYFTVEDLIRFCEQKKMYNFSSKESGKPIFIQAIQDFSSADVEETADNKLYAKVRVCHTLLNRNGSYISEDSMKAAIQDLVNATYAETDNTYYYKHIRDCSIILNH